MNGKAIIACQVWIIILWIVFPLKDAEKKVMRTESVVMISDMQYVAVVILTHGRIEIVYRLQI